MLKQHSLGFLAIATALSLSVFEANPAEAATWDLSFSSGGMEVGSGQFTYAEGLVAVVRSPAPYWDAYIASKDDPIRPDFVPPISGLWTVTTYPNPVTSFVANLPGQSWSLTSISWWAPEGPGTLLGSIQCSRGFCGLGQWFGGSTLGLAPGQFLMSGGTLLSDGRYVGSFISAPVPSSPPNLISGTWVATAVPEPITVMGTVLTSVGLLVARKKRSPHG